MLMTQSQTLIVKSFVVKQSCPLMTQLFSQFSTGLQGQSHVVFLERLVLLICPCYITLHLEVQQG